MAYQGTWAEIPLGSLGVITDAAPGDIPISAFIHANNITLTEGVAQKAPGTMKRNSVALPAGIIALTEWRPNLITTAIIAACSNGSLYYDQNNNFNSNTAIKTGLIGLTPNCMFVEGGAELASNPKKLFFFSNGENQVQVLSGTNTSFSAIEFPSPDWDTGNYPRVGTVHRSRMWVFSKQLAYASDTEDHENFQTNTNFYPVYPGEGGDIMGVFVYKGRLFCFKEGGFVYWLNDSDVDSDNWSWFRITSAFGLAAPNAIVEAGDDMLMGNDTGTLTSFSATQKLGEIEGADMFALAGCEGYLRKNTHKGGLTQEHLLYYAEKKQILMTYRSTYTTANDMLIVIDIARGTSQPPRIIPWKKGSAQCLALYHDINNIERPIYGDKDGFVHIMDREDRNEGGTAYTGEFQIPNLDLRQMGVGGKNKHFDFLAVKYKPEGNWNLSCDYFVDGKYMDTVTFPMIQNQNSQLNVLVVGSDRTAQEGTETFVRPICGTGRTFSARFYNAGSNESFQVAEVLIGFRPAGEQAQRTG